MIQIQDKDLKFGLLIQARHFAALAAISEVTDKFYITGSIALSFLGIIRRPINDVDVVVWDRDELKKIHAAFGGEFYENYNQEKQADIEDDRPKHLRFDLAEISVCVFYMQYESTSEIIVRDQKYTISDPEHIMRAKFNYIHNIIDNTMTDQALKRLTKNINDVQDYTFHITKK